MLTESETQARDDMLSYIERLEKRSAEMDSALRDCLLLAMRNSRKQHSGGWEQIIRFCKQAGVEPSPLRDSHE